MSKIVKLLSIFVIGALLVSTSCSQDKSKKIEKNLADQSKEKSKQLKKDFNKAKQVFYSLPSPIETAMLIKRSGVSYAPDLLNPLKNQTKYISTYNLAMNLGVYTADISYASIFNQSQTSIKYMATAKNIAESLGILDAIDQATIERLENNINNRDSIMDIISATFMNSDSFLKENGRPEAAALIIAGGWIEGLYLATQHARISPENEEIVDRIIDQKISLQSLTQLLKSYNQDEKVNKALVNLLQIEEAFEDFKIVSSDIESVTSEGDSKTILKAKTNVYHDKTHITKLTHVVDSVRTAIVVPE
ncbi:MAG: hypothetical protein PF489_03175 [Salinivirgaceae bacterium]|jgi:hypothetical protein|nr:hypothetical protein [Salinivirgaceae bacterium]